MTQDTDSQGLAGLLCLVGLKAADAAQDAEMVINKILAARMFHDSDAGKNWARSVSDVEGELLLVSQFTLYGRLKTKNPDFSRSMRAAQVRDQQFCRNVTMEVMECAAKLSNVGFKCTLGNRWASRRTHIDCICKPNTFVSGSVMLGNENSVPEVIFHCTNCLHAAGICIVQAKESYEAFVQATKDAYVADKVKDGVFGAMMDVSLVNDGPVTYDAPSTVANAQLSTGPEASHVPCCASAAVMHGVVAQHVLS